MAMSRETPGRAMAVRRDVVRWLLAAGLAAAAAPAAAGLRLTRFRGIGARFLWLRAGSEEHHVAFRDRSGALSEAGLSRLCWAFRDRHAGDVAIWMDPRLFDLLAAIQTEATLLADRPLRIELVSGFRTARRNLTIEGAAPASQHIRGRAADFALAGLDPRETARIADRLGAPGLGRYARFTHVDVGPGPRRW